MRVTKGLIIADPWIGYVLEGSKTWEMRSSKTSVRGPFGLIRKGWVVLDSDWESEFCRVAESHPKVLAYTKNHNLGLEVPYRYGSETRKYLPDFIVQVDDGSGPHDPLSICGPISRSTPAWSCAASTALCR
jgi:hypothetical protein